MRGISPLHAPQNSSVYPPHKMSRLPSCSEITDSALPRIPQCYYWKDAPLPIHYIQTCWQKACFRQTEFAMSLSRMKARTHMYSILHAVSSQEAEKTSFYVQIRIHSSQKQELYSIMCKLDDVWLAGGLG